MSLGASTPGPKAPRWAWWVATGFGSGYLKPAPGTWGSLAAVGVWFLIQELAMRAKALGEAARIPMTASLMGPLAVLMTIVAIRASGLVSRETGLKDPSFIVADEWAGMWVALIPVGLAFPLVHFPLWVDALRLAVPFALFRLFDIWKPWPIFQIQQLPGGKGIVMDDVVAGVYAAVLTFFLDGALLTWLHHRQVP
ncbi:MAG TPA: phosphatidylglycerophosphatase A [Holophagaceae bacterium]|nr:phosphatidylglycerophosphatase A [Holophagaceae bacterium]